MRRLGTKQEVWAVIFLWACFSLMALSAIHGGPNDPGGVLRVAKALGLGAFALVPAVIFGIGLFATNWLRRKIAYLRLSPLERYAARVNGWTKEGRQERADLKARLQMIQDAKSLRQTLYHDPLNDRYWLGVYWEQGHANGEDLKPLDRRQLEDARRLFDEWRDKPVPTMGR